MKSLSAYLQPGEEVKYRARIHLVLFVQPAILLAIGYVCYLDEVGIIQYLGVTLLFLGLVSLIQRLLIKLGSVYIVTNLQVIFKNGIIARRVHSLILFKVEGLQVTQSFMGRILNYGTIVVTTGGATNIYPFVANPMLFRKKVNIQIEEYFSE